jgi:hypothetical protein
MGGKFLLEKGPVPNMVSPKAKLKKALTNSEGFLSGAHFNYNTTFLL